MGLFFSVSKILKALRLSVTVIFASFLGVSTLNPIAQGCHSQGKISGKIKFFPGQGKVREFCGWPGKFRKDLESQGKVREFENKWLWQAVFRKFIYSVEEGKCTFPRDSLSPSPPALGATLKGKNLLPWGANSFL